MVMDLRAVIIEPEPHLEQTAVMSGLANRAKSRNLLGLNLQINVLSADETNEVLWTLGTSEESSPITSSPFKGLRNDDSGFSSDDSAQFFIEKINKLSRSKSLRSALRTPTHTSSKNEKTVRFADSLGLDLVHKNYYEADDVIELENANSPFSSLFATPRTEKRLAKAVRLSLTDFPDRTEAEICRLTHTQCVCLQCVKVIDTNITGKINVLNITCEKQVYIRYTTDNWETSTETAARYENGVGDGAVDAFTFFIAFPINLPLGATCQFCIRYVVNGMEYWDSNQGRNYTLHAVETSSVPVKCEGKLVKLPHATNCKHRQDSALDDYEERRFNFLPFSMRSTVRSNSWRRQHTTGNECFLK